jgi:hypothetical protein
MAQRRRGATCPSWSSLLAQDLVEEGILVSPRMMADHMPDYLTGVLRRMGYERAAAARRAEAQGVRPAAGRGPTAQGALRDLSMSSADALPLRPQTAGEAQADAQQ